MKSVEVSAELKSTENYLTLLSDPTLFFFYACKKTQGPIDHRGWESALPSIGRGVDEWKSLLHLGLYI